MTRQVVILCGGYAPATRSPGESDVQFGLRQHAAPQEGPPQTVLAIARDRYDAYAAGGGPGDPAALHRAGLDAAATEGWRRGWHEAAMLYRILACWVIDGPPGDAARFAAHVTAQIDPAFVLAASDPLTELLDHADNQTGRTLP